MAKARQMAGLAQRLRAAAAAQDWLALDQADRDLAGWLALPVQAGALSDTERAALQNLERAHQQARAQCVAASDELAQRLSRPAHQQGRLAGLRPQQRPERRHRHDPRPALLPRIRWRGGPARSRAGHCADLCHGDAFATPVPPFFWRRCNAPPTPHCGYRAPLPTRRNRPAGHAPVWHRAIRQPRQGSTNRSSAMDHRRDGTARHDPSGQCQHARRGTVERPAAAHRTRPRPVAGGITAEHRPLQMRSPTAPLPRRCPAQRKLPSSTCSAGAGCAHAPLGAKDAWPSSATLGPEAATVREKSMALPLWLRETRVAPGPCSVRSRWHTRHRRLGQRHAPYGQADTTDLA